MKSYFNWVSSSWCLLTFLISCHLLPVSLLHISGSQLSLLKPPSAPGEEWIVFWHTPNFWGLIWTYQCELSWIKNKSSSVVSVHTTIIDMISILFSLGHVDFTQILQGSFQSCDCPSGSEINKSHEHAWIWQITTTKWSTTKLCLCFMANVIHIVLC